MCTVSIAMLSPSAKPEAIRDEDGLRRRDVEKPAETRSCRDDPEIERLALGSQPAAPHVVGERRHRELLGDLRLAHERAGAVSADQVALAHEIVEGGAHREPGNAEVRAQLTLGRDRVADGVLLDEVEHEVARLRLLRHAEHRNRPPVLVKTRTALTQCAAEAAGASRTARPGTSSDAPVSASKKWNRDGIESEANRVPHTRSRSRIDTRIEKRPAIGHQVRRLVRLLIEPRRDARGVDAEEDVRVGAELLEHDDLGVDRRQFGRCERRVLERLRPDAEDDGAAHDPVAVPRRAGCGTDRTTTSSPSMRASTRFIAGDPMNPATNRSHRLLVSVCGVSTCRM